MHPFTHFFLRNLQAPQGPLPLFAPIIFFLQNLAGFQFHSLWGLTLSR
ncbi:hypothetical protein OIU84_015974 [Salix udensis]|uniref:Uncharacterized protein n=1 Tax=Salix udensis TaxID=889485 RepID=A0AAD6NPW3_9ROSI|nr:hypothetical protein OIU84_015974 [Salix udensis]